MRFWIRVALAVVCSGGQIAAQNWFTRGVSTVGADLGYILTSPSRLDGRSASRLVGLLGLGAGLIYSADAPFGESYGQQAATTTEIETRHSIPEALAGGGVAYDRFGTNQVVLAGAGLLAAAGWTTGNERLVVTAARGLEAVILSKTFTSLSKRVVGRARPFNGSGPRDFQWLDFGNPREYRSLPSGHSSSAFALATVLATRHPKWWVRIGSYALATSVAIERVDSRSHWISDTLFGGAIGYAIGKAILRNEDNDSGWTVGSGPAGLPFSGALQYAF